MKRRLIGHLLAGTVLVGFAVSSASAMGTQLRSVQSVNRQALSVNVRAASVSSPSRSVAPSGGSRSVPASTARSLSSVSTSSPSRSPGSSSSSSGNVRQFRAANVSNIRPSGPQTNSPIQSSNIQNSGPGELNTGFATEQTSQYGIVTQRPDFKYNPNSLRFQAQNTSTTGQLNMGIGPGRPSGAPRFVPVGEF